MCGDEELLFSGAHDVPPDTIVPSRPLCTRSRVHKHFAERFEYLAENKEASTMAALAANALSRLRQQPPQPLRASPVQPLWTTVVRYEVTLPRSARAARTHLCRSARGPDCQEPAPPPAISWSARSRSVRAGFARPPWVGRAQQHDARPGSSLAARRIPSARARSRCRGLVERGASSGEVLSRGLPIPECFVYDHFPRNPQLGSVGGSGSAATADVFPQLIHAKDHEHGERSDHRRRRNEQTNEA